MRAIILSFAVALTFAVSSCGSSEAKTVYQCPMKCEGEKTYDSAGKCPLCQMDMEKVK